MMTTPFLPIPTNTANVLPGQFEAGSKGSVSGEPGLGEGNSVFSDVLIEKQQVLPHDSEASKDIHEDQAIADLQNQGQLSEFIPQVLFGDELIEHGAIQLHGQGLTEATTLNSSLPVQRTRQIQEAGQHLVGYLRHTVLPPTGQGVINDREGIVPASEHTRLVPTPSLFNRLSGDANLVGQAVDGQGVRVRPLLNENARPILDTPLSSVSVTAPFNDSEAKVQRLLSSLEGSGGNTKAEIVTPAGSIVPPLSREDNTQSLSRVDGDGKTIGTIGTSQIGEAGSGTSGGGLPFGNHPGSGQGQMLDSSSGNLLPTNQGQLAAKGGSFDDRLQLLNTNIQQRLQIDVQLSDAARVQVDVGVQQRQVYAGVLMDNPVLRALASQNVQDLENQLGQAKMELEEFDVHGESPHLDEQTAKDELANENFSRGLLEELEDASARHDQEDFRTTIQDDQGWHLVA